MLHEAMGVLANPDAASQCGGKRLKGVLAQGSPGQPLVTVVTAVYNGREYLAGCLDSVLAQDYPNIEHIVLDGASTDGTVALLRQYEDRITLWRSEPDGGVYDAWNKALLEARGQWICFLGVDDEFLPGAVSAYMALAAEYPDAEYLSSTVRWVHPSGHVRLVGGSCTWQDFLKGVGPLHVGSMHRKSLFERYGAFDTSYRICADYEFLLRPRADLRAAFLPGVTVRMRGGGISDSLEALQEAKRARIETGGISTGRALLVHWLSWIKHKVRPVTVRLRHVLATERSSPGPGSAK